MSEDNKPHKTGVEWRKLFDKLSLYTLKKGFRYLKHYGIKEFWVRLQERFEPEEIPYEAWYEAYRPKGELLDRQRRRTWEKPDKISIVVPAYQTPVAFLSEMIASVQAQTYPYWELCIVNASPQDEPMSALLEEYTKTDVRIRCVELSENLGIAGNTNAAFEMATGTFTALLDHDDLLAPNALYEVAQALERDADIDLFYSDEDKVTTDGSEHFQPHLKPDFSIDLLRSNNYICHFLVVRTSLVRQVGGFRTEYDGAQDYDFIFRVAEQARKIHHIPEILYHWRTHKASTADNPASKMYAFDAGKRAIEAHLGRVHETGEVSHTKDLGFYRVSYPVQGNPLVSIVIPNKDEQETLLTCLQSIRSRSSYTNYEIIIVENNSETEEIFACYEELKKQEHIKIITWNQPFNYAAINNFAVAQARGDYILFLNNDVEVITQTWLEEMIGNLQRPQVAVVGAKLYYPDDTIQHAGCIVGMGGVAGHIFTDMDRKRSGYLHKASIQQNMSAVTAACMMVEKSAFLEVGGFTEELAVAFNDVDFCLKIRSHGFLIVYNPFVELYHFESKSRGAEDSQDKVRRFQEEIEYMRVHWRSILCEGDPYYNKNLSLTKWNYSLKPLKNQTEGA
ncbi:MAG: glycosyltransferase family 2 protein [Lachnospiraceae bacterium]